MRESVRLAKRAASRNGVTIVEVVLALFLAGLLSAGMFSVVVNASNLSYATAQRTAAFTLCKEQLERMRSAPYNLVTDAQFGTATMFLTHLGGSARVPLTVSMQTTIAELSGPKRKRVTITANWQYRGRVFSETLNGVIYEKN